MKKGLSHIDWKSTRESLQLKIGNILGTSLKEALDEGNLSDRFRDSVTGLKSMDSHIKFGMLMFCNDLELDVDEPPSVTGIFFREKDRPFIYVGMGKNVWDQFVPGSAKFVEFIEHILRVDISDMTNRAITNVRLDYVSTYKPSKYHDSALKFEISVKETKKSSGWF